MSEETLRRQLYESYKNRARIYHLIFEELRKELGAEQAEAVLKRAIYRRGVEIGTAKYAAFAPDDLAGLKAAFLDGIPDAGRMFQPEVLRATPTRWTSSSTPARSARRGKSRACRRPRSPHFVALPRGSTTARLKRRFPVPRPTPGSPAARCCRLHIRRKQ